MDYPVTMRLPCSVCGIDNFRHSGWYLVVENRWLDRLRIFSWHPSLAVQKDIQSACSRQHLKTLIGHWLNQASLRLPPFEERPLPIAGVPDRADLDLDKHAIGRLVGELSVHRETFSRGWTGSAETLECILDALIPSKEESKTCAMDFQLCNPSPESPRGVALL